MPLRQALRTSIALALPSILAGAAGAQCLAWDPVFAPPNGLDDYASALGVFDDGSGARLCAGGAFTTAGGVPAARIASWNGSAWSPLGAGVNGGVGALLAASGSVSPDSIVLSATDELPSVLSIFLQGNAQIAPTTFGDGLRCAGGTLKRLYTKTAAGGAVSAPELGDPSITAQSLALGDPIAPGASRYYQTYYRDSDLTFCADPPGNSWNVTNSLRIRW